jgi:hypothetical protein
MQEQLVSGMKIALVLKLIGESPGAGLIFCFAIVVRLALQLV